MYAIVSTNPVSVIELTHDEHHALEVFEAHENYIEVLDGTSGEWREFSTSDTGPGPIVENSELLALL